MSSPKASGPAGERHTLVSVLPQFLWPLLAAVALWLFYEPLNKLIEGKNVSKFSVAGLQIEFAQQQFAKIQDRDNDIATPEAFAPYAARIRRNSNQIRGASILWVDDKHPTQNVYERRALSALGISVDMARSTTEAISLINQGGDGVAYDLIISDVGRPGQPDADTPCFPFAGAPSGAGCGLLASLNKELGEEMPPTILYTASYDPDVGTPGHAFGITNRVDKLLELVLDALERRVVYEEAAEPIPEVPSTEAVVGGPVSVTAPRHRIDVGGTPPPP